MKQMKCTKCGADMAFTGKNGIWECPQCGDRQIFPEQAFGAVFHDEDAELLKTVSSLIQNVEKQLENAPPAETAVPSVSPAVPPASPAVPPASPAAPSVSPAIPSASPAVTPVSVPASIPAAPAEVLPETVFDITPVPLAMMQIRKAIEAGRDSEAMGLIKLHYPVSIEDAQRLFLWIKTALTAPLGTHENLKSAVMDLEEAERSCWSTYRQEHERRPDYCAERMEYYRGRVRYYLERIAYWAKREM